MLQDTESGAPGGLAALAVTLAEHYTGLLAQAGARLRLSDALTGQLRDRLTAFAAYLLTAGRAGPGRAARPR